MERLGFKYLDEGAFKIVYADRQIVVKISNHVDAVYEKQIGASMLYYETCPVKERKHYLPLFYESKTIQIQKRVKICNRTSCDYKGHWDGHSGNHAHIKGLKVMVDY